MAAGVSEDTFVQNYQFEPESDPEQDDSRKEVRQLRLEDVYEWLVNVRGKTYKEIKTKPLDEFLSLNDGTGTDNTHCSTINL